jgi:hypothetical protein
MLAGDYAISSDISHLSHAGEHAGMQSYFNAALYRHRERPSIKHRRSQRLSSAPVVKQVLSDANL